MDGSMGSAAASAGTIGLSTVAPYLGLALGAYGLFSGMRGANSANAQSIAMMQDQESYNWSMASTQYRRGVADMIGAGLNPMLAYSNGGAASAAASQGAPYQNPGTAGMVSAGQAAGIAKELALLDSNIEKTDAETAIARALIPKAAAEARLATSSADQQDYVTSALLPNEARLKYDQAVGKSAFDREFYRRLRGDVEEPDGSMHSKGAEDLADVEARKRRAEGSSAESDSEFSKRTLADRIRMLFTERMLKDYEIPGARAAAARDESPYGQSIRPYLHDIGSAAGSALGLKLLLR